jgi:sulfur transfer complex TusBCD TusB component (DsrH family)
MATLTKSKNNSSSSRTSRVESKSRKTAVSRKRNPSVNSIENGIKILELAIKRNLSASRAATQKGFGRNYISDIRARVSENYSSGNINKVQYATFVGLYKQYEKNNKR